MAKSKTLVDSEYVLEKFPGKGGWTYARVPEIAPNPDNPFGWVIVKGSIDGYKLQQYKLMPMGNGRLFLPVKNSIRKKIGKEAGDTVHIRLELDDSPVEIPDEIIACFECEPQDLLNEFMSRRQNERKAFLDWIYSAKSEDTKAQRILDMMDKLMKGQSFYVKKGNRKQ